MTLSIRSDAAGGAILNENGIEVLKFDAAGNIFGALFGPMGQCRLIKSGANLVLQPYQGNRVTINGKSYAVPAAGVSLAPAGAAANTTYFIYLLQTAGVLSLEYSATAHATDTSTTSGNQGVEIKSGDASRTLVGMARTTAGIAWVDTDAERFVISWFNRRAITAKRSYSVDRTTGGNEAVFNELNTEIRTGFLCWAGDLVRIEGNGTISHNGTGTNALFGPALDTAPTVPLRIAQWGNSGTAGTVVALSASSDNYDLTEGYHYVTLATRSAGANSVNFMGVSTDPQRATRCTALIQG